MDECEREVEVVVEGKIQTLPDHPLLKLERKGRTTIRTLEAPAANPALAVNAQLLGTEGG